MKRNLYKLTTVVAALSLVACGGDDGINGSNGTNGANGMNGSDGSNGVNSLVAQVQLAIGHNQCPNGGIQINSGLDVNDSGILDSGEVSAAEYVCSPARQALDAAELLVNVNNSWYIDGVNNMSIAKVNTQEITKMAGKAKNVILFVGDGMGVSTVTASRIFEGQMHGMSGEENTLSFGEFPFSGLAKTYNVDAQTPDSAGTMTAMMTGVKTDVGVLNIDEDVVRGDCSTASGNELITAFELAEIAGKSTGVVSTARITHATPAATYAKSVDRNWEYAADGDCEDIASQLVNFEANLEGLIDGVNVDGIEVVMGGGRRNFLTTGEGGRREDGRNLITEWETMYENGVYIADQNDFDAVDFENTERVFALFNSSHMQYEADRENDDEGEPSLTEMTSEAINLLDNNNNGFFLVVESGRIDHAHHAGNAYGALVDTVEFASAVEAAANATNPEDTLIIVTADHSHVFTIAGYPKRGNPILGKVVEVGKTEPAEASDGLPYTTLGYTNGRGMMDLGNETDSDAGYGEEINAGRMDLSSIDTESPGYHQEALVPTSSETHAGEDVGVYARGPGSHLVNGTNEQNIIFHIMDWAALLEDTANKNVVAPE